MSPPAQPNADNFPMPPTQTKCTRPQRNNKQTQAAVAVCVVCKFAAGRLSDDFLADLKRSIRDNDVRFLTGVFCRGAKEQIEEMCDTFAAAGNRAVCQAWKTNWWPASTTTTNPAHQTAVAERWGMTPPSALRWYWTYPAYFFVFGPCKDKGGQRGANGPLN